METATRRTGFVGVGERVDAVVTRVVTAARLESSVEVRAGVAVMLGSVVDGVVMAVPMYGRENLERIGLVKRVQVELGAV